MPEPVDSTRVCPGHHDVDIALRDDEHLCRFCVGRAMRNLEMLAAEFNEVDVTVTGRARTYRGAPRPRVPDEDWRGAEHALRPTPLPFNEHADTVRAAQVDLLREWADFAGRLPQLGRDVPPDSPHRIAQILDTLKQARNWLRTNEQGGACADAIAHARQQLRATIDRRDERWFAGPCGQPVTIIEIDEHDGVLVPRAVTGPCTADLYARAGAAAIVCDGYREPVGINGCGATHPAMARHKYVIRTLRDKLLPLPAILAAIPQLTGRNPDRETVKKWRQRGKLRPVVSLTKGPEGWTTGTRWRGGDVLDLVLDDQPRPGPRRRDRMTARSAAS